MLLNFLISKVVDQPKFTKFRLSKEMHVFQGQRWWSGLRNFIHGDRDQTMKQGQDRTRSSQHPAMSIKTQADVRATNTSSAIRYGRQFCALSRENPGTAHDAVAGAFAALCRVPMDYGGLWNMRLSLSNYGRSSKHATETPAHLWGRPYWCPSSTWVDFWWWRLTTLIAPSTHSATVEPFKTFSINRMRHHILTFCTKTVFLACVP